MRSPSRSSGSDGEELKKGAWTPEEDQKLIDYIEKHGQGSWQLLPKKAGLKRCGKSCRLRWTNYLRPDIKRGNFTPQEEQTIIHLHSVLGNKWSMIASRLPGRTDNEIKNYWNTHLRKRLIRSGIDPKTHQPIITYPMLPNSLINNNHPLENLAKIKILYNILQILQPNPSPSSVPIPLQNPIPILGQPETLIPFNGLLDPTILNPLQQAASSSSPIQTNFHVPLLGENQPTLNAFGALPGLVDGEDNGVGITSKMSTGIPEDGNDAAGGRFDELDEILNYKGLGFGSNKSSDDGWGEVIDGEANAGACDWKDVLNEFFPSS